MIKSLFGDDEPTKQEDLPESEAPKKTDRLDGITDSVGVAEEPPKPRVESQSVNPVVPFEVLEPIGKPKLDESAAGEKQPTETPPRVDFPGIEKETIPSELEDIKLEIPEEKQSPADSIPDEERKHDSDYDKISISPKAYTPESTSETMRKTGLAWSAAIVLFGSVAFMMVLGWFVDLTFGTQPGGVVGGIIIGAVIGFVQFFRTTAQILKPPKTDLKKYSLFSDENDDK